MDRVAKLGVVLSVVLFVVGISHEVYSAPPISDAICGNWTCANPPIGQGHQGSGFYLGWAVYHHLPKFYVI